MRVGVQLLFQSYGYGPEVTDAQVYAEELGIVDASEALGFDSLWSVEHHFEDYAFCPDNVVLLSHVAARTRRIALATGAVIVPWNDPLRVAEKISMLDHLAPGRVLLGLGRGLARREYERLHVPMDEARGRFDEAGAMILDALETGIMKSDGPFYPRESTPIRPVPRASFQGRVYCVANSADSTNSAADLGGRMIMFPQKRWPESAVAINAYRARYEERHGVPAPPPSICDYVICDSDASRAEERARHHILLYLQSILDHYEMAGDHFKDTKGYEAYGETATALQRAGFDKLGEVFLGIQAWGTPEQILERLRARREIIGPFELNGVFRFAGIPFTEARRSMELFARDVLPVLQHDPAFAVAA